MPKAPTQVEPANTQQVAPVVRRYAAALASDYAGRLPWPTSNTPHDELIPIADLPALVGALQVSLAPASERQIAETLALIASAWPYAHQRTEETTLDLHMRQLTEDLAEFPADALRGAVRRLRREMRFMPSIAELYQTATELVGERRVQLLLAQAHQREHSRRAAEAERQAREEALRQEKYRRDQQARIDRLALAYGAAWRKYTVDDLEAAWHAFWKLDYRTSCWWLGALDRTDPAVCAVLPMAVIAGRVLQLREQRRLVDWEACKIIQLASRDPDGAAVLVSRSAGAARRALPDKAPSKGNDTVVHPDPLRLFGELIEARRKPAETAA